MANLHDIEIKRQLRPCIVDGKKALFHCWQQRSEPIEPSPLAGGHPGGIMQWTEGIVEMESGYVRCVLPKKIVFVDHPHAEYDFGLEEGGRE